MIARTRELRRHKIAFLIANFHISLFLSLYAIIGKRYLLNYSQFTNLRFIKRRIMKSRVISVLIIDSVLIVFKLLVLLFTKLLELNIRVHRYE